MSCHLRRTNTRVLPKPRRLVFPTFLLTLMHNISSFYIESGNRHPPSRSHYPPGYDGAVHPCHGDRNCQKHLPQDSPRLKPSIDLTVQTRSAFWLGMAAHMLPRLLPT